MASPGLNFEDQESEGDGRNWLILAGDRLGKPNVIRLVSIARAGNRVPLSRPALFSDTRKASWQSNPTASSGEVAKQTDWIEEVDLHSIISI